MEKRIAAVILAAGGSSRFGQPKQLLEWNGQPLINRAVDTAWSAGLDPIIVVTGAYADDVEGALADRPVQVLRNYGWEQGLSTSLRLGVAALTTDVDAAVFMPVDQPQVDATFLRNLVSQWAGSDKSIAVPMDAQGKRSNPALFARKWFPQLVGVEGDIGGRKLIAANPDAVYEMPVADATILSDVDTPERFALLQAAAQQRDVSEQLSNIRGIISDMDGVLWRGLTSLPGMQDLIQFAETRELGYVLVTNNSSRTPEQYLEKLAGMGVETTADHVLGSSIAAAHYVAQRHPGATIFPIGGTGVYTAFRAQGLTVCDDPDIEKVDFVVVGWDRALTWDKLATATRLIHDGAVFVGTNPDLTYPLENHLAPGNGAQLAALQVATETEPVIAGKPSALLYQQAMDRMGTTPETTLVIGDRLDTDILGGVRLGMPTALVLTGISQREELAASMIKPTFVLPGLPELLALWQKVQ